MQTYENRQETISQFEHNQKGKLYILYRGGMYTKAGSELFHGVKASNIDNVLERHKNRVIIGFEFWPTKTNRQMRLKGF